VPADLPTGTVTLLFTDIEGSTRMLQELGREAYVRALTEHRRLLREAFTAHGGVEVEMQGDSFHFAFPYARDAVAAAAAGQRALAEHPWEHQPIKVRVGLHTGEPMQTDGLYAGLDVHQAARLMSAAHGDQVLLSARTADLVDGEVDVELIDLGEHRLKDLIAPQRLYQLGAGVFPPLKTISNTNLPHPASSFVGREREVAEIVARVEAGARLLTLTGPGGSGKTRLAIEAAAELVPEYPAGVVWIGLASLREAALVSEAIAQALGARNGLAERIAEQELLLLLDNFEHLIDAAPELPGLLERCPNLTLLVTSRELLRVTGEAEYPVPALAEPEAVALFCQRTRAEPSEDIGELCRRLDSLPLAVELAAARAKALSPRQIVDRLSQRLDLLKGGRDADPRQQTLRATIQWSYDLLTKHERDVFARLSVFVGGCTLEAAEEAAGADIDTLQSLVEKSLLRYSNERYWMLETIREFAWGQLEQSEELADTGRRHADFLLKLTRELQAALGANSALHTRFAREHDNFRAALAWAEQTGETGRQLDLISQSWQFWWYRGHAGEGLRWVESALARGKDERSRRTVDVLAAGAMFAYRREDLASLRRYAEESLALARALEEIDATIWPLILLGIWAVETKDYDWATSLNEEAIAVARETGDRKLVGIATNNLGNGLLEQGDLDRAVQCFEEALAISRELGTLDEIPTETLNLARSLDGAGRFREAVKTAKEGLALAHEVGTLTALAYGFILLGAFASRDGASLLAARLLGVGDLLLERVGEPIAELAGTFEAAVTQLLSVLGEKEYGRAFAEGRAMTLDDAMALALQGLNA
jgi:predicted ATPase/class 3 adenylate cyclase